MGISRRCCAAAAVTKTRDTCYSKRSLQGAVRPFVGGRYGGQEDCEREKTDHSAMIGCAGRKSRFVG